MGRSHQFQPRDQAGFRPGADDTGCDILHVDMDAFFASVEIRRRPELRGRPVIVGGTGPRGVVSSASYEARAHGVRSAMPLARARQMCPQGVFLPCDHAAYRRASARVMEIFRSVTPLVEPLSLDEAFLDVSGARRLFGAPTRIAAMLRARVLGDLGLTCSVGVASTMFMAKLGSSMAKPDGVVVIPQARVLEYLHPLPVTAIWGVGERTREALHRLGLRTVGDVAAAAVPMLRAALGVAAATHVSQLSQGRDSRTVTPDRQEKSIGAETTFDVDVPDGAHLRRTLLDLSDRVAVRLRATGHCGRTIGLKIRFSDFRTLHRSRTLPDPTDVARDVYTHAVALFDGVWSGQPVRLLGVRVENMGAAGAARQLTLDDPGEGWRDAERAIDAVSARFGRGVIRPASLIADGDSSAKNDKGG